MEKQAVITATDPVSYTHLWLCLLCSFLLLPLEIQAQKKGDSITGKVHKIDEVTVTERRPPAKITTGSPVQLLSLIHIYALKGVDIPILIKNPVNPDLELWIGAFERINNAGLKQLGSAGIAK